MAASIANFPDVQRIKSMVIDGMTSALNKVKGKKDMVIDADLMKPLDRIAGAALLKSNGVDKIFKLDLSLRSIQGSEQRIYLVRPLLPTVKCIAEHINADKSHNVKRKYHVIFVPRSLYYCEMILEQEGVYGDITIGELELDLIPLDRDILSLELPGFYKNFYLDLDETWLHTVARSLIGIQAFTNPIPNVYCIGKGAKMTYDLMNFMLEDNLREPDYSRSEIGSLIIIDREVDYVTPLCSQLTYEGLLDETFGIKCGFIEFGTEVTGKDQGAKLLLSSDDQIFEEVRNRHFSNVLGYLSEKAKSLQQDFDKRHNLQSVGDMKNFVSNELRGLKQQKTVLAHHIGACEQILAKKAKDNFEEYLETEHSLLEGSALRENVNFIEELMNKQYGLMASLRLLCLLSLTQDGISSRDYKSLKTQFLHSYGFEQMLTFNNLKKLGILTEQDQGGQSSSTALNKMASGVGSLVRRSSHKYICKKLNLIPKSEDINLRSPTDVSYVFSGAYSPLSCKLVEQVLNKEGFVGLEDITRHLPGGVTCNVRIKQQIKGKVTPKRPRLSNIVLVYFLGGCTYSEITALRFLGKVKGYRFMVATTSIETGTSLLETVTEKPPR